MPSIAWVKPAPLWKGTPEDMRAVSFERPWLVELDSDNFLPEFLDVMEGRVPGKTPAALAAMQPKLTEGRLKLYQPLHGRYYLVVGSLVCRQLGLPDRGVTRKNGELTSFVLRRVLDGGVEQGWVDDGPNRGWQPLVNEKGKPVTIRTDEERLPLHPVSLCAVADAGSDPGLDAFGLTACGRRAIYYGYIPVAKRNKYITPYVQPSANPAADLDNYVAKIRAQSPREKDYDFRLDDFDGRVLEPWRTLISHAPAGTLPNNQPATVALYLLLDFGDFLQQSLPSVFAALGTNGSSLNGADKAKRKALFDALMGQTLTTTNPNGTLTLAAALKELEPSLPLVRGQGDEPAKQYSLPSVGASYVASQPEGTLHKLVREALAEETAPRQVPEEVSGLLRDQITLLPAAGDAQGQKEITYYIRLVYEHAPCVPVLGPLSDPFTFAAPFDPDAPARHLRIELPSIKPKDLRKLKRGVGMQMSPDLRDLMNRVNKDMLTGGGLSGAAGGWELGMICSFSIQIITLVAFIVMFIFLILLNIVFWWLPFLKICFPIPVKK